MNICVYGASSNAIENGYISAGEELGRVMASRGHSLIFGAGAGGLMGAVARGCKEIGGEIIGVVPSFFNVDGVLYDKCDELIFTDTMRQRKQIMEDRADAFVMTPGGIGTFEEFFEILTLKQVMRHNKPIAVLNTNGYFNPMIKMLEYAADERFMTEKCLTLAKFFDNSAELIKYLEEYTQSVIDIEELKSI